MFCFGAFFSFLAVPSSMQDPTRDRPAVEAWSLNYRTTREVPAVKYFLIKVSTLLFKNTLCYCVLNRLHHSVNINFLCTGRPENSCDLVYCNVHFLLWPRAEPSISLRFACIYTPYWFCVYRRTLTDKPLLCP